MTERFIRDSSAPFNLEFLAVEEPVVATNFSVKLPENYTYELVTLSLDLVTDVNAANRMVIIQAHLGTDLIFAAVAGGLQTASESLKYSFSVGTIPNDRSAVAKIIVNLLPTQILLPGGTTISSTTEAIQAGDQYSNIRLYLKRWPILEG